MTLLPVPAGPPIDTMPTRRIGEQIDGDALLGGPAVQVEQRAVASDEVHALVVADASQRGLRSGRAGNERDARVARQVARLAQVDESLGEQFVDGVAVDVELDEAVPARVPGQLVAVLVGVESDDAGLEPQRQVLGDDGDVVSFVGQVLGDGEDPVVVVVRRQRGREPGGVLMVQLDPQRAARFVGRQCVGQRTRVGETVRASATPGAPPSRARDGPASPRAR